MDDFDPGALFAHDLVEGVHGPHCLDDCELPHWTTTGEFVPATPEQIVAWVRARGGLTHD